MAGVTEGYEIIPKMPDSHRLYIRLNALLSQAKNYGVTGDLSAAAEIMLSDILFAEWVAKDPKAPKVLATADDCWEIAKRYLFRILWARDYQGAALLLWGPETFDPRPRFSRLIFDALKSSTTINAMGGASASKTYSGIAWSLLDWVLDPNWTQVLLVGPDANHCQRNMFADLVRLHESSVIKLPGRTDSNTLSTDKKRGMGFFLVALDKGTGHSAKLKGIKTKSRDQYDHPLFGTSGRVRIIIDEAQEVPVNAWDQLLNGLSNAETKEHFKVYCAANPSDDGSVYGKNCKPVGGWNTVTATQERWISATGWTVIRLNAMLSENVAHRLLIDKVKALKFTTKQVSVAWDDWVSGVPARFQPIAELFARGLIVRDIINILKSGYIFPRLTNWTKVQEQIRAAGGDDQAPGVHTQVYGMFPPQGAKEGIIKPSHLDNCKGEWIFVGHTRDYLTFDPAYDGGDRPAVAAGRYGLAGGWVDRNGVHHALEKPMHVIQVDSVGQLQISDLTQDLVDQIFGLVKQMGIRPDQFGVDCSGIGKGCYDNIRSQWAKAIDGLEVAENVPILGITYAGSPSQQRVWAEDTSLPNEIYHNTATELWYAASKLFERGVVRISNSVDAGLFDELLGRRGGKVTGRGVKLQVETKGQYKARGNRSPDFADAVNMLLHLIRLAEDFSPANPMAVAEPDPPPFRGWNNSGPEEKSEWDTAGETAGADGWEDASSQGD